MANDASDLISKLNIIDNTIQTFHNPTLGQTQNTNFTSNIFVEFNMNTTAKTSMVYFFKWILSNKLSPN